MSPIIIGCSVCGASHIKHDVECQDSYLIIDGMHKHDRNKYERNELFLNSISDDIRIISVADGHGSKACPYSKTGSKTAVNVFCDIMVEYAAKYKDEMPGLFASLNREGDAAWLGKRIVTEWEARITKYHKMKKRDIPTDECGRPDYQAVWKQYGTTLLGMLFTRDHAFAFQLGDGDITYVSEDEISPVIDGEKILGVETHSISKPSSWTKIHTQVINLGTSAKYPFMYILSTDGLLNSHVSENEFYKTCKDYFIMIRERGPEVVENNLQRWLSETSRDGCGDDITTIFVYFKEE